MGIFDLFSSQSDVLKEKIIVSQKGRIASLEKEVDDTRNHVMSKENELKEVRTNFERSKDRLVDQIIDLSDKFAQINQRMLDIAHENARLKFLVDGKKKSKNQ